MFVGKKHLFLQVVVREFNLEDILLEFFNLLQQALWSDEPIFLFKDDCREKAENGQFVKGSQELFELAGGKSLALGHTES